MHWAQETKNDQTEVTTPAPFHPFFSSPSSIFLVLCINRENMSITHKISIDGREVKTTVISTATELDGCLKDFLSAITQKPSNVKSVVGLGIETSFGGSHNEAGSKVTERVAILKLCHYTTCLIIQLHLVSSAPCSLLGFFQRPELSFVGVGIRDSFKALEKEYGIKCRNAVDLGQLAATTEKNDLLRVYGLLDLTDKICDFAHHDKDMVDSFNEAALSDWGVTALSKQQIEAAAWTCFLCFCIGNRLFGGYLPDNFLSKFFNE
uniref:3'-5' exonuclease domain-containing protein n=1 Tax=Opuntia streptacantha TaxID=393608 RepID=A0A7C9DAH5_OPUST